MFASAAVDALARPGRPLATALLLSFLPPLFTAALILLVGWLVANFLSQGVLIAAVNARLPEARLVARGVYWGVVLFSVATALAHVGIGKEMVLVAFGITFGGVVFALALAFGLGGRAVARHILERRLRRESPPPQERISHLLMGASKWPPRPQPVRRPPAQPAASSEMLNVVGASKSPPRPQPVRRPRRSRRAPLQCSTSSGPRNRRQVPNPFVAPGAAGGLR